MKIHEYQAKAILKKYDVAIQDGIPIKSMDEFDGAISTLKERGVNQFVVKSQIHAGGRGKGLVYNKDNKSELIVEGGVKFFGSNVDKAREYASKVLGNILVTHQTGIDGKQVQTLFIAEGLDYKKELYLSILLKPLIKFTNAMWNPQLAYSRIRQERLLSHSILKEMHLRILQTLSFLFTKHTLKQMLL